MYPLIIFKKTIIPTDFYVLNENVHPTHLFFYYSKLIQILIYFITFCKVVWPCKYIFNYRDAKISFGEDAHFKCIQDFLASGSYDSLLLLDPDTILEESNTIAKTVIQDLPVLSTMLLTNTNLAKKRQKCEFGWGRVSDDKVTFPDEDNKMLLKEPRTFVSNNITY